MEFSPSVKERNTKELFNIISNDEKWAKEIQILAEEELYKRNYSKQIIAQEKNKRLKIIQKLKERQIQILEKNRKESYSILEMILIAAFFPFSLILHLNPLAEFWKLNEGNYKKKIWQRIILIIISLLLWIQIVRLIIAQ